MTICEVYVGDLDDPDFHWDGGNWNGNVPKPIYNIFPIVGGSYNECFHRWVNKADVECRQTDFGGWVSRVTKQQLVSYIEYCYGEDPKYADPDDQSWKHLIDRLKGVRHFIESLEDGKVYALVATEF